MTPVAPQVSPYGVFNGNLFQYKTSPSLVAFESSPPQLTSPSPKKCILIGGLSDGLIPTPYAKVLESTCHELGWSLVQPMISSSGLGFGHGSLSRDSEELGDLLNYLIHHCSAEAFAFVGHSTGCQNSVHFMKNGDSNLVEKVKVVALQAPVSDREDAMTGATYKENITHARKLHSMGKEEEMMPRSAFWAPITASRFLSLQDVGGEDDFFSSDFSDDELNLRLGHLGQCGDQNGLKTLVAFSGKDEYVPQSVNKGKLLKRLCQAMRNSSSSKDCVIPLMIENGNHNLSNDQGDKDIFVDAVERLLRDTAF